MQSHPVLSQVALGYSPMINRQHSVVATRLTIFPQPADALPDSAELFRALDEVWPPAAGTAAADGTAGDLNLTLRPLDAAVSANSATAPVAAANAHAPLSLNIAGEALLQSVLQATPAPHRMIEVPAFMAADPAYASTLRELHAAGAVMLIKGRPLKPLAPDVLACFAHSIVELADDRRTTAPAPAGLRKVSSVYAGARTRADAATAFERGAVALLGWQLDDPAPAANGRVTVPPDVTVVLELIQGVDKEWPASKLEVTLKRDPMLSYKLLRYLNSPAFGMSVEITSFGHALMMLGHQRLKRWLVLLLTSTSKDARAKPITHAAVRRGLILEELVRSQNNAELSGELFICGVFSLLDRLLQLPVAELLKSVPLSEPVQMALSGAGGPYLPYLELVRAIEGEAVFDIRANAEALFLSQAEVNTALLKALRAGQLLD